jgi:hypothetical protein
VNEAPRRERNAGRFGKRDWFTYSEGNQARDPRARDRAAIGIHAATAGSTRRFGIAMKTHPRSLHWQAYRQGPQACSSSVACAPTNAAGGAERA